MAAFEEVGDLIEEAIDGIDGEAGEAQQGEEAAEEEHEIEAEAAEAREAAQSLRRVVEGLRALGNLTLSFLKFVATNAAMGAIFCGVMVALKKLMAKDPQNQSLNNRYNKVKKISDFIKYTCTTSDKINNWLKEHKDDEIKVDGIKMKLIAVFSECTDSLANAADEVFKVAKTLMTKSSDGKVTFTVPTADQVSKVITGGEDLVTALKKFHDLCEQKSSEFPVLKTFPLTKEELDTLQQKLDAIKCMPF